jgi:hypothetical protein
MLVVGIPGCETKRLKACKRKEGGSSSIYLGTFQESFRVFQKYNGEVT